MAIPHRFSQHANTVEAKPSPRPEPVAQAEPTAAPPADADAVAVRAIARFNVERRQAGEPPLDLKGIERLRKILSETLGRSELLKQKDSDDSH